MTIKEELALDMHIRTERVQRAKAIIEFLRKQEITYEEAIEALKEAQSELESASLKNRL